MKKIILITGGLGYIGSHGVVTFEDAGYTTVIIDNLSNSNLSVLDNIGKIIGYKPDFYNCDLRDREKLEEIFKKYHFDGVLHFAGLKSPKESCDNPLGYFDNNIIGSIALFECMKKYDVKNVIFSSSASIYMHQGMGDSGLTEEAQIGETQNPYATSKRIGEIILYDLAKFSGFRVVNLRYFNPIGAHNSGLIGENPIGIPNNLLPSILKVAAGELPELQIFGNDYDTLDGTGIRDYIDVNDLIESHVSAYKLLEESPGSYNECINVGTGKGTSVLEILNICKEVIGKKIPYKFCNRREGDLGEVYCNTEKAKNVLSWYTKIPLEESVKNMWEFSNK